MYSNPTSPLFTGLLSLLVYLGVALRADLNRLLDCLGLYIALWAAILPLSEASLRRRIFGAYTSFLA